MVRDPQRKPLHVIAREMLQWSVRERELPFHYVAHLLYKQGAPDPHGYVGSKTLGRMWRWYLPKDPDLDDKRRFQARAEEIDIPVPLLIATTTATTADLDGRRRQLHSSADVVTLLRQALDRAPAGSLFIKPHDLKSGKGCFRVDRDTPEVDLQHTANRVFGRVYLIQETLFPHADLARVHEGATGCLRVHTLREGSEVHILSSLMRFPVADQIVDAPIDGAIFTSVDDNGKCSAIGYTYPGHGGVQYLAHPGSGVRFAEVQLPDWGEVQKLVRRAALGFSKTFIGWDIAFTHRGPVFTEGNSNPHFVLAQIGAGGFRAHEKWRRLIEP